MKTKRILLALLMALTGFAVTSCSGPTVDETKPIAEIETEAEEMTAKELRRMAEAYQEAILEKQEAIEDLQDKLAELEPDELLSSEAKAIAAEADTIATSLAALTERFELYVTLLEGEEDGDISGLTLE